MKSSNRHVAGPVQYTWKGKISPGHDPMDVAVAVSSLCECIFVAVGRLVHYSAVFCSSEVLSPN